MKWIVMRTVNAAVLLSSVLVLSFALFSVFPGDVSRTILGPNASVEAVERLSQELGTDRPLSEQFVRHLESVLRLDLGRSAIDSRAVGPEVAEKFGVTARLALLASLVSLGLSYLLVFASYSWRVRWPIALSRVGSITPAYCAGVLAVLFFGVFLPIVPLGGYGSGGSRFSALILPAVIAAGYPLAVMTGVLDNRLRAAMGEGYARTAEAFGMTRSAIFHKWLLPASLVPWLAAWVNQLSLVFVASFILEVIFTIPGTGVLLIGALQRKDYPMLQGILLANAVFFIVISWLADLAFRWLDPRVRDGP